MLRQRVQRLTWTNHQDGGWAWCCDGSRGCQSRFTDSFLRQSKPQIDLLMAAIKGMPPALQPATAPEVLVTGERMVIVPKDDDE